MAKVSNVLLPLACYYLLMTLSRNCGKMLWILFIFLFFGAFQIVLLYPVSYTHLPVNIIAGPVSTIQDAETGGAKVALNQLISLTDWRGRCV